MLRRAAAAAVVLAGVLVPVAAADGGGSGVGGPGCKGATLFVKVCANDGATKPGSDGGSGKTTPAGSSGGGSSKPTCTYTKLSPQPSRGDNMYWRGHEKEKGAVYGVNCPDTDTARTVFIADGTDAPAGPQIDPEVVARRAVDSMLLVGPKVASPRPAGIYVVGMPMWMWAERSPNTYGPVTASATAGGVTVTATAQVATIRWDMGDSTSPVTCTGPGTPYDKALGKTPSPDCGHRYEQPSTDQDAGKYRGSATATWAVDWEVTGGGTDQGQLTETRRTPITVTVHEVQVLN